MSGPEPGVRASDAEREAAVERLTGAAGEGRLTLDEFSLRLDRAHGATTRAELETLTGDLPAAAPAAAAPAGGGTEWSVSPIGGTVRTGRWRMPRRTVCVALIGGARLDLTDAQLSGPEVTVTKVSLIGGMNVVVPPGVRVLVSGFNLLGGRRLDVDAPASPTAPVVRLQAYGLIGGVRVRSR